jgi:hypothetical protein
MITLNTGVHVPQFDAGTWVPVPKSGQYLVHFILPADVLSERYHNVAFTGGNVTSGRLLLSRFVWSIYKIAKTTCLASVFQLYSGDDDDDKSEGEDDAEDDGKGRKGKGKQKDAGGKSKKGGARDHGRKRLRSSNDDDNYQPSSSHRRSQKTHAAQGTGLLCITNHTLKFDALDDEATLSDEELLSAGSHSVDPGKSPSI